MKKEYQKKGFTLVELLAVIVILAVIAIITTPMILGVIDKAKKGAFQSSVKGIEDSIELQQLENEGKITNYTVVNGVITNSETSEIISTKGGNDINGNIKVKKDGRIVYALNNGNECIIKRDGQEEIEQIRDIKFCTMDVATNLVKNGYGEYGDNTNFSNFTYENGAFVLSGSKQQEIYSDEYIKVDTSKKYFNSVDVKNNGTDAKYFSGLLQFDYDTKKINVLSVSYVQNSLTTLAQDLKDGDTVVHFTNLSNQSWKTSSSDPTDKLGFIFWNYKNSSGNEYAPETYSRNFYLDLYTYVAVNQSAHTITLKTPWNKGTIAAGTKVSRSSSNGASYSYGLLSKQSLMTGYQTFSNTMVGTKDYAMHVNYFSSATEYVKWFTLENYYNTANTTTYYKNIIIREIEE